VLLIYVDDIIIAGNNLHEINHIKMLMNTVFKIKDMGPLRYFLGIKIARSHLGITISQRKCTLDLLASIGLLARKAAETPMVKCTIHPYPNDKPHDDVQGYRRLI
jgi:hypothetical protein